MENYDEGAAGLAELGEALTVLKNELKRIPSFKVLAQSALREEFLKLSADILFSRVNVNVVAGGKPLTDEPVGGLRDVLIESLRRGRAPAYDVNSHAVFDHPSLTDRSDAISQVSIADVERVIRQVMSNFTARYRVELQQYWEGPALSNVAGAYPKLSRKAALNALQAELFMRELVALVDQDAVSLKAATSVNKLIKPGVSTAGYGVVIPTRSGERIEQSSMFVLPVDGPVQEQLPVESAVPVLFYSPERGIETFASALELQQTLLSRLRSPDTRSEFFHGLSTHQQQDIGEAVDIRFVKASGDLFERYTNKLLDETYMGAVSKLAPLAGSGADFESHVTQVESAQLLEDLPRLARLRQASLLRIVQRNAWPLWLKNIDTTNQDIYVALEQRLLESQVRFHEATKGFASLKDFVKSRVEDFISPGTDERIDPDTVFATVNYYAPLANGQNIQHRERKTLTQLFMYGVHDDANQLQITVEGQYYNSKYTQANLVHAIRTFNLRVAYNEARQAVYSKANVAEIVREVLGRKTALSLFRAVLRKHLSAQAYDVLTRYNLGDLSLFSANVALGEGFQPFKELMVFRSKSSDLDPVYLYAPGFPSGQEWFEFGGITRLIKHLAQWVTEDESWDYLKSQAIVTDIPKMVAHVTGDVWAPRWIAPSDLRINYVTEDYPLENSVNGTLRWEAKQIEAITPVWYRTAKTADQQLFTRLSTDLKLISQVSKGPLTIIPFHEFARDLVIKTLQQYRTRSGDSLPAIDPDKVLVTFHAGQRMTLTNLFIQWQLWRSDVSIFETLFKQAVIGGLFPDFREQIRKATFITNTGHAVPRLNAQIINELIDLKPGEHYDQYLRDQFLDTPDRGLKENLFRKVKQNEMLRTALLQKINGTLSPEQFNWLQALINGLDQDIPGVGPVDGRPGVGVYNLTLQARNITGAYIFGRQVDGRNEHIVYVPGTQDGADFFPLVQLAERLKKRAFAQAVSRLVRLEHRQVVENYMRKYWDYPIRATGAPEITNSGQIRRFKTQYAEFINGFIADVDFQTTSSAEAFWKDARILGEFVLDVVSMFVPPLGLGLSVLRVTHSVIQGIVASSLGNDSEANGHFASAWRGAIMLYLGKVSAIGAPVNPLGLLSQIKDYADLASTVTGVPVTVSYLTAVAVPPPAIESTTRLIN